MIKKTYKVIQSNYVYGTNNGNIECLDTITEHAIELLCNREMEGHIIERHIIIYTASFPSLSFTIIENWSCITGV